MAATTKDKQIGVQDVRFPFVEMLFALAISQVAIAAADVVSVSAAIGEKLPALSHLLVALILIATSWVGWKQSRSPGMAARPVTDIWSTPFVGLLTDVALVILYFIVARTVEIGNANGALTLERPTAWPESMWVAVVFAVYAWWDVITDVVSPGMAAAGGHGKLYRLSFMLRVSIVSMSASLTCLGLSAVVWRYATRADSTWGVVLLDLALVSVILAFRDLKALENHLSRWLRVETHEAFLRQREEHWVRVAALVGLGAVFVLAANCL